jgi:hypothetical protein
VKYIRNINSLYLLCREFLGCEYAEKFGTPRIFTKENMPGSAPKVRAEGVYVQKNLYL